MSISLGGAGGRALVWSITLTAAFWPASRLAAQVAGAGAKTQAVVMNDEQDHAAMMKLLGIEQLRPGPSGDERAPNHANYDEALANPYPQLPDVLTLNDGRKVTSADEWRKLRRPELIELFSREVYGRAPSDAPAVTWRVAIEEKELVGFTPVIAQHLVGHVDNRRFPAIDVEIKMTLVRPAMARGPVPVLVMFAPSALPAPAQPSASELEAINAAMKKSLVAQDASLASVFAAHPAYQPIPAQANPTWAWLMNAKAGEAPPTPQQILAAGWGYALLDPASVQADNGAGLTRGVIGLCNLGQPRKADDWGALRAWAWGASRAFDYLASDKAVDSSRIGVEGVSRYGKAALVTMAFDERFAVGLIGSSGEGGAKLHRRNFGEAVESLTGGEYYWMAGNFMKYGAEKAVFGRKDASDLPVDAHELIALAAPRPLFISYGAPAAGDAKWLDQQGSFMATVAAGVVYRLLGARDLGVGDDYKNAKMPPINQGLLAGELAWRQHDGGHTDAPNIHTFLEWANRVLHGQK